MSIRPDERLENTEAIEQLRGRLASVVKELREYKAKTTALQLLLLQLGVDEKHIQQTIEQAI